jgi:hypothetical protein
VGYSGLSHVGFRVDAEENEMSVVRLDFASSYAEMVLGNIEAPDLEPATLEHLYSTWFDEDEFCWYDIDDIFHGQAPVLERGGSEVRCVTDGVEQVVVADLVEALKNGEIQFEDRRQGIPHRKGDKAIGAMAWERFRGVLSYSVDVGEGFEFSKLALEVTEFVGLCDLTEGENNLWVLTGILYDGKRLEVADVSGHGTDRTVSLRYVDVVGDEFDGEHKVNLNYIY